MKNLLKGVLMGSVIGLAGTMLGLIVVSLVSGQAINLAFFSGKPQESGQSAFGAISEAVKIIERQNVDWEQVDMDALWEHLKDMNALMTHVSVEKRNLPNGLLMNATGGENAARAMNKMIPAHSNFLVTVRPQWDSSFKKIDGGYAIRVTSDNANEATKIKALGFSGFMVQDDHHASHHLKISSGMQAHTH